MPFPWTENPRPIIRIRRRIKFCKQNTAMLIVLRENELCRTSTRHRKNSKQSGIVTIDSCFALVGARQYGVTTQKTLVKISEHSKLRPDLELSTPTESRYTTCLLGSKSPSVKLMSRRENKKNGQHQPIEHGQNHAKITAYRIYKRSTAPEYIKYKH